MQWLGPGPIFSLLVPVTVTFKRGAVSEECPSRPGKGMALPEIRGSWTPQTFG